MSSNPTPAPDLVPCPRKKKYSLKDFELGHVIGSGASATVRYAVHKKTKQVVAIKSIDKYKLREGFVKRALTREIENLKLFNHRNVVKLYAIVEETKRIHLVMEFVKGTSLNQYMKKKEFV